MSRPSFKRYFSLNDQDEYKRRICTVDDNDDNEANERDETVGTSENELCTLNEVDNNVIYERTERSGRQLKRYYSVNGQHQYDNGISLESTDHDSPSDENITIQERENMLGKRESTLQPTKIYERTERPGRQLKRYYSVNGQHQYDNGISDHDSPSDENITIEERENIFGKSESTSQPTKFNKLSVCRRWKRHIIAVFVILVITTVVAIVIRVHVNSKSNKDGGHGMVQNPEGPEIKDQCLLYEEPGDYDLQSNPFRERCQNGSKFVTKYCSLDDGSVSKHKCLECLHGDLLPNFCFCDVGHQCERVDAPMKQTCSWCKNNCPCLNDGNCSCVHPNTTGEHIRCSCPTGYGGRYCEVVLVRLCKTTLKSKDLADCAVSLYEECYIISGIGKSYMTCKIYTGDSVETSIPNCTEVTTRR